MIGARFRPALGLSSPRAYEPRAGASDNPAFVLRGRGTKRYIEGLRKARRPE